MLGFTCPWVSVPLRDITRARLRFLAAHPTHRFDPSSGFRNLSTASSALELAGLFHPAATSRVRRSFRGFSPVAATLPLRKELPPCRCCIAARTHAPTFIGSYAAHVRCLSTSRPRSAPGRVLRVRLFTSPKAAPLFEFHAPPGARSLDVGIRSHGCLPLYVTRSIFVARAHLSMDAFANHLRGITSPCSLEKARTRSSCRTPSDSVLFRSPRPLRETRASRALLLAKTAFAHTTRSVTAVAGLACFAGSSPFGCFELGGAFARSPCGDSSVRSRLLGVSSPSVAVSQLGALFRMRCLPSYEASRVSDHFALVEAAHDQISHLSMREIVLTAMHALLLMPAHVLTRLAAIEPARRHVRSRRRRQLSCASSSRDALFVFPRRGRRGVSCPRSLHDPSFDGHALEARGCASCFSLLGARDLRPPSFDGSKARVRSSVPAVVRSLSAAALILASRRS